MQIYNVWHYDTILTLVPNEKFTPHVRLIMNRCIANISIKENTVYDWLELSEYDVVMNQLLQGVYDIYRLRTNAYRQIG